MKSIKLILAILCFVQLQAISQNNFTEKKVNQNHIKFDLVSPLLEHLTFSYERSITNSTSLQFSLGIIGIGFKHEEIGYLVGPNEYKKLPRVKGGISGNFGVRFYRPLKNKSSDEIFLDGFYVEPNIIIGSYQSRTRQYIDNQGIEKLDTENATYGAGLFNLGFQKKLLGRLTLDIFGGFGLGIDNSKFVDDRFLYFGEFHRGLYKFKGQTSLALKGGLKVGYAF